MASLTLTLAAVPPQVSSGVSGLKIVDAQTLSAGNDYTSGKFQVASFGLVRYTYTATLTGTTSPTLDFKVQALSPDGTTWDDVAHDTQQTATATRTIVLPNSPAAGGFTASTALAAASFQPNAQGLGMWHRLVITVGGTNVSFATTVWMDAQ